MIPNVDSIIARDLLIKHAYMYETGALMLALADGRDHLNTHIPELDITERVLNNKELKADKSEIDSAVAHLVSMDYILLRRETDATPMYVTVTNKGVATITSGEFLQKYYQQKRDELQGVLAESTISTNVNVRRNNRVIAYSAIATAVFACGAFVVSVLDFKNSEELKPSLELLRETLQKQGEKQQQIATCLQELIHSIQTINADTTAVRVVK